MKVQDDRSQVSSAEKSLASAEASLSTARSSAALYGQSSTFTKLPAVGQIIRRGQSLYEISGQSVVLLYGSVLADAGVHRGDVRGIRRGRAEREPRRSRLRAGARGRHLHRRDRRGDTRPCNPRTG